MPKKTEDKPMAVRLEEGTVYRIKNGEGEEFAKLEDLTPYRVKYRTRRSNRGRWGVLIDDSRRAFRGKMIAAV